MHKSIRTVAGVAVALAAPLALSVATAPAASAATGHKFVDFNGDTKADRAISAPGDGIYVKHGGGSYYHLDGDDVSKAVSLGVAMDTCDVNNDGFTDLVAGDPDAEDGSTDGGGVFVFYGSASGLSVNNRTSLTQDTPGVPGVSEGGDGMGLSVACGAIDGDSYDDLLVGVPFENIGSVTDAGTAVYLRGSASGVTTSGSRLLGQDTAGISGTHEKNDRFGYRVAIGDVPGGSYAEAIISAPGENENYGQIHSLHGTATSLTTSGSSVVYARYINQGFFGYSLAVGDYDGNGTLEVAVGGNGPYFDSGGSVSVVKSDGANLSADFARTLNQDNEYVVGSDEQGDVFGFALSAGDITGDGVDDLLVGAPGEAIGSRKDAGAVTLLKGEIGDGLTGWQSQGYNQDSPNVAGTAESGDNFGLGVAIIDNGAGVLEAAVGSSFEDVGSIVNNGSVTYLKKGSSGLTATGSTTLSASTAGGNSSTRYFGYAIVG